MCYLATDGYKIKTPLFDLRIHAPDEYADSEASIPEGVFPEARLQGSEVFQSRLVVVIQSSAKKAPTRH
jgi:hypothetical protein